jgi:hypothetical protein
MKRITKNKILIFNKYGGDPDAFARTGSDHEKYQFEKEDWTIMEDYFQRIELIKKGLVSNDFKERVIKELKELADEVSFDILVKGFNNKAL